MNEEQSSNQNETDVRVKTTRSIWALATGMLGICIPLSPATGTGAMIPIAVLAAAGVSSVAIWMRGGVSQTRPLETHSAAKQMSAQDRVQELEERLANLEAITNFEHKLLDSKYSGAAPIPTTPTTPVSPPMPVDSGAPLPASRSAASRPIAS